MDYKKNYKKQSELADKLIAKMEAKSPDKKLPDSFVSRKEKAEVLKDKPVFDAAKYMAELRVEARVTEQLNDSEEDEDKEEDDD